MKIRGEIMPELWGRTWTKDELKKQCGQMSQIAGVTRAELQEGFEKGVEILDIKTGSGFRFGVCPSRGMDIVFAQHKGRSLCWNSSTALLHPAYYEAQNLGWLRGFSGGLLTTCGFSSFSMSCEDDGEYYGMHDRASYLPASRVKIFEEWNGEAGNESYEIAVEGVLRQTRVFGPNISVTRRITTSLGASTLRVQDRVVNEAYESAPFVILYHCNFGFPVVSEHSIIRAPSVHCEPRGQAEVATAATWMQLEAPQAGIGERCYFHTMQPDESGKVRAEILNQNLNFGAFMEYSFAELPHFTQWKMMGAGTYVNGLEPSNAPLISRAALREKNLLPMLEPGEEKIFELELGAI
jgi:hypothetical protein